MKVVLAFPGDKWPPGCELWKPLHSFSGLSCMGGLVRTGEQRLSSKGPGQSPPRAEHRCHGYSQEMCVGPGLGGAGPEQKPEG